MKSSSLPSITSTWEASSRLTSLRALLAADRLPERGAVVEVVGDDGAVLARGRHRLLRHERASSPRARRRCRRCGTSALRLAPKTCVPVDVARLHLRGRGVPAVGAADGRAHAEAALGEVEAVPGGRARRRRPRPSARGSGRRRPGSRRSSRSRPTGLSTRAVTTAVRRPKQRFRPRATLYSPPPSHARNARAVWIRVSPGSRRSMTSPRLTRSKRHADAGLRFRLMAARLRPGRWRRAAPGAGTVASPPGACQ